MPQYVEMNGHTIEFPDGMGAPEIEAAIKKNRLSIAPTATPAPEAPSRMERIGQGMRDPIDGSAQLLTKMLPQGMVNAGNSLNNWLADNTGLVGRLPAGGVDQQVRENEAKYQASRGDEAGRFDAYRMGGNVLSPANVAIAARTPQAVSTLGRVGLGALGGAASGAMNPVTAGDDFTSEKLKQVGVGGAFGGAVPAVVGGVSRVVSPKASVNPNVQLLKSEGVTPTIGQALGGRWNTLEEKATSLPIAGDMISSARARALSEFNNAAINRASGKVGAQVEGTGQGAIREAGDAISQSYDDALSSIKVVRFDPQFGQDLAQLKGMAQSLTPPMRAKFNAKLDEVVGSRMSGAGSMLGPTYKKVDSEIGQLAAKFGKSSVASESELGDAFTQLQNLLKQQAMRSNPNAATALKQADAGWANLVRLEGAAKAGKNAEGLFTPAQLNAAIQKADSSVRGRSVSRGTALMQDLGNAGQQVIGNKVPNSFTTDRALIAGGGLGAYFLDPLIPAGLLGAGAMYTQPMQALLSGAVANRPQSAQAIAEALRKASPGLVPLGAQMGIGLLN